MHLTDNQAEFSSYNYKSLTGWTDSKRLVYAPQGLRNYLCGLAEAANNRGYLIKVASTGLD